MSECWLARPEWRPGRGQQAAVAGNVQVNAAVVYLIVSEAGQLYDISLTVRFRDGRNHTGVIKSLVTRTDPQWS